MGFFLGPPALVSESFAPTLSAAMIKVTVTLAFAPLPDLTRCISSLVNSVIKLGLKPVLAPNLIASTVGPSTAFCNL